MNELVHRDIGYEMAAQVGAEFQAAEMRKLLSRLKRWTQQNDVPPEDDFDKGYENARAYVRDVLALYQVGVEVE